MKKILLLMTAVFFTAAFSANAGLPEPYDESKDITNADRTFVLEENTVTISYSRPAVPLKPFDIIFKFDKNNIKNISYTTNMKMNMGRYVFTPEAENGAYSVTPTLPKCASGGTLWYGRLDITYNSGKSDGVVFFYNLK